MNHADLKYHSDFYTQQIQRFLNFRGDSSPYIAMEKTGRTKHLPPGAIPCGKYRY